jgi:hypothetical protein
MALGMRWLWLSRTDPSHCWRVMPLREDPMVIGFFYNSITLHLGDGRLFAFWTDPWLDGAALSSAYPELVVAVPARLCRVHMVASVLDNNAWVRECARSLNHPDPHSIPRASSSTVYGGPSPWDSGLDFLAMVLFWSLVHVIGLPRVVHRTSGSAGSERAVEVLSAK